MCPQWPVFRGRSGKRQWDFSAIVQLALWHIDGRDKGAGNKGGEIRGPKRARRGLRGG